MGRPSLYTSEIVAKVCELLSQGITLEEIGRMEDMPSANTLHDWKSPNNNIRPNNIPDSVASDIARAREIGYDAIASRLRLVAAAVEGHTSNDVQRDKLIIETDLKLLAKWTKKYADKSSVEVGGIDGKPIENSITVRYVDSATDNSTDKE